MGSGEGWLPSSGATITTEGMSNSTVGTVLTPGLAAGSLAKTSASSASCWERPGRNP